MPFNLALLKEHPYATGGVVIVGGLVVFYLLSSSSSGSSAASSSTDNGYAQAVAAQTQLAQAQMSASVTENAQSTQLQEAQVAANSTNLQTSAAQETTDTGTIASLVAGLFGTQAQVQENSTNVDAQTTQQANQLMYAQNLQSMQDSTLEDNINQAAQEQDFGTQANLIGLEDTLNSQDQVAGLQASVASQGITDATTLATQQEGDSYNLTSQQLSTAASNDSYVLQNAGKPQNSALDATDQTDIFASVLNNPTATATVTSTGSTAAATAVANAAETSAIVGSVSKGASSIVTGLFG